MRDAKDRPLLAITMGDPAGTGPEILTRSLTEGDIREACRPVVIGDAATVKEALAITGVAAEVRGIEDVSEARFDPGLIEVVDLGNVDLGRLERGRVDEMCGQAAYEYIERATRLALDGAADAVVTSAISKEALNGAGHHFDGHTGLLAHLCGTRDVTMMLVAEKLRVAHVSTHVALREAIEQVRPDRILKVLELAEDGIRKLGVDKPRLAVAGLNPHAGEGGLFGDEEAQHITPAIDEARRRGFDVSGPHPGDTVFFRALQGEFDGAIAMYHDQGHVAAKMLGIWLGVNVTLGLPIIRTSVEHGTSFDKAGQGTADPRSMNAALKLACAMAATRHSAAVGS
jgi:4-hydroxythreonine-4-phosphate dehydrogenase